MNVLPTISKILEKVLLQKVYLELAEKSPMHEAQRGFTAGQSTIDNIHELVTRLKSEKDQILEERRRKVPAQFRKNVFVVF